MDQQVAVADPSRVHGNATAGEAPASTVGLWEWGAVVAVLAACALFVWTQVYQYWFRADDWVFLNESATSLHDLLRPHGGHLTAVPVIAYDAMHRVFEMDYFPGYVLFRVLGSSLMGLAMWRIMRHRGADPVLALFGTAYLCVLASTVEYKVLSVGMFVAMPALLLSFLLVDERPEPSARDQVMVGALLLAAMLSIAIGALGVVGLAIAVVLSRRRWHWLPVCGGLALMFGLYTLYKRDEILTSGAKQRNIFEVAWSMPSDIARLASNVAEQLTVPGATFGIVLFLLALAGLAWAARRGLLGFFEAAALVTVLVYFASIAVNRLHTIGGAETLRTANAPALLLVPALLPIVRMPRHQLVKAAVLVVAALLVVGQANDFAERSDEWESLSGHLREQVSSQREMLLAGEPYLPQQPRISVASPRQILGLAGSSGWDAATPAVVPLVRGKMRMGIPAQRRPIRGLDAAVTPRVAGGDTLGECATARAGTAPLRFDLAPGRLSQLVLRAPEARPATVVLRTVDRFGPGRQTMHIAGPTRLGIITPKAGDATLSIRTTEGAVAVCPFGARETG